MENFWNSTSSSLLGIYDTWNNSSSSQQQDQLQYQDHGQNCTSTSSCDDYFPPPTMFSVLVLAFAKVLYGIVCLVGLVGNTLVIYVVLRFSKMQTVTNMYILNLALADEMFLIGLPFLIITFVFKAWPFGSIMCKLYMTSTSIVQFTSSLLLTVMSADRYVAVCHPISSPRYRTPSIAKFICLIAWTASAFLMVPIFMFADTTTNGKTSCNIIWPESVVMDGQKAFTLYSFTLGFFMPCILIFIFYFLVICRLRTVGPKNKSKEKKKSHRKVTILVLTVITVYVLCWLPHWIGQLYISFLSSPSSQVTPVSMSIILLVDCLSYANSAMNPILYAFLSENFKKSFARAFTCAANNKENVNTNAQHHPNNADQSVNPRTTRGGPSGMTSRTARGGTGTDRTRLQDQFVGVCDEELGEPTKKPFAAVSTAVGTAGGDGLSRAIVSKLNNTHIGKDEEEEDDDEDAEEIDIEEEDIPMTSRLAAYAAGGMVNRKSPNNKAPSSSTIHINPTDRQILIDSDVMGGSGDQQGIATDSTTL